MHILEGQPYLPDNQEERHPAFEVAEEQGEDERVLDSELFHGWVHIPQQPEVELINHEKPQSHHTQKIILQIRLIPKKLVHRPHQIPQRHLPNDDSNLAQ